MNTHKIKNEKLQPKVEFLEVYYQLIHQLDENKRRTLKFGNKIIKLTESQFILNMDAISKECRMSPRVIMHYLNLFKIGGEIELEYMPDHSILITIVYPPVYPPR